MLRTLLPRSVHTPLYHHEYRHFTTAVQRPSNFPIVQSMIELSRTQDEEVGDGTTSVIILGNLLLCCSEQFTLHQACMIHLTDLNGA